MKFRKIYANRLIRKSLQNLFLLLSWGLPILTTAQTVNLATVKLNNVISTQINLNPLKKLIEIDSIVPIPNLMDMSVADSLVYVGSSYFEYYKSENMCYSRVIIFDEKIKTVSIGSQIIDKTLEFPDLKQIYPLATLSKKPIKIMGDDLEYYTCRIQIEDSDNYLVFFFSENRLKRIDIWEPS